MIPTKGNGKWTANIDMYSFQLAFSLSTSRGVGLPF